MVKRLALFVALLALAFVASLWLNVARTRTTEHRRDVLTSRTLVEQRRFIDGLVEQVDEQADEIARLETALKDAQR